MLYFLVRLQHHHVTEEFGTIGCDDPYDYYIGDTVERTNLRFTVVNEKAFEDLLDSYIPDDPYDYESVNILCEFSTEYEMRRFLQCMKIMKVMVTEL